MKPHINHTIGSQIDFIPTVIDLLGASVEISSFGRSLLRSEINNRFVPLLHNKSAALLFNDFIYIDTPNTDGGVLLNFSDYIIESVNKSYKNNFYKSLSQSLLFSADYSIKNYKFLLN